VLLDIALICDPAFETPLIQVYAFDASDNPVPGVGMIVTWDNEVNRFYTGLKPEFGLGYADFAIDPMKTYVLRLEDGGDPVSGLTGKECEGTGGERYYGSWRLNFTQP
jgi:hypothetical protein